MSAPRSPLRQARIRANLTGSEVAAKAGISESYLSLLETGKRPLRDNLAERLTAILGDITEAGRRNAVIAALNDAARARGWAPMSFGEIADIVLEVVP